MEDRGEDSGGIAFAIGPCDVAHWPPMGQEVRENEANAIPARANSHVRTTWTGSLERDVSGVEKTRNRENLSGLLGYAGTEYVATCPIETPSQRGPGKPPQCLRARETEPGRNSRNGDAHITRLSDPLAAVCGHLPITRNNTVWQPGEHTLGLG